MKIADLMTRKVTLISPDTKVPEIARKMRDDDVGAIPVVENDRLIGMVTDRDIVIRGLPDGRDPDSLTARDLMSGQMLYCYADQDPQEVLDNMGEVHVRRLPVMNRDKQLVGIVSLGDLAGGGPAPRAGEALQEISKSPPDPA